MAYEYRIQKGSPIIPILRWTNPIPRIDTHFIKIHSNIVLPSTPRPSYKSRFVGEPINIYKALEPSSILAALPVHLNLLNVFTLTILGERYKL
jgi:hypothetical protein